MVVCLIDRIAVWRIVMNPCPPTTADDDVRTVIDIARSLGRCAVFVRNIDLALRRAEASYSPEVWQTMTASERSAAIYRELRALDAKAAERGNHSAPSPSKRRGGRRRTPRFQSP